jgi:peptidoglycan/LPS O-acetylase OafA/YrhL
MPTRRRILLFALALVLLSGLAWLAMSPRDPLFHGKPESQWITNIVYGMGLSEEQNREQVQRWRDFGPDGLRVLERGLAAKHGRAYQTIHRRLASFLPGALFRLLPRRRRKSWAARGSW